MLNDPWWTKSVGHIIFHAEREYINIKGEVYCAPRSNTIDPSGIRYGAVTDRYTRSVTPAQIVEDINNLLRQYPKLRPYAETGYKFLSPRTIS